VYEDRSTLERQEALPEVEAALALFRAVTVEREATLFHVTASKQ
jgi:hypothetical protein